MGAYKDLSGSRFGKLSVVHREGTDRNKKIVWLCQCDCGRVCLQRGCDLTNEKVKSCGCSGKGKLKDISGYRFGMLTVVRRGPDDQKNHKATWQCKCNCGTFKDIRSNDLVRGRVTSCGCNANLTGSEANAFKHGWSGSRIYNVWIEMRARCSRPDNPSYEFYGGRGISFCPRWESFECFLSDMGRPLPGQSLDRIDNDKGYCKENCKWAKKIDQANNRRTSRFVTIDGVKKSVCNGREKAALDTVQSFAVSG